MMGFGLLPNGTLATLSDLDKIYDPMEVLKLSAPSGYKFKFVKAGLSDRIQLNKDKYDRIFGFNGKTRNLSLLNDILELPANTDKEITVYYAEDLSDKQIKHIKNILDKHEKSKRIGKAAMLGLQNTVVRNILDVLDSPQVQLNMSNPITTDTMKNIAKESLIAKEEKVMTLDNPFVKFDMQEQNMTGKSVVGIGAVSLKHFFAATTYFNSRVSAMEKILESGRNLNSLAEPIDEDYYVDVYKIENTGIDSVNNISLFDNHIYEKNFRLSYHSINPDKPTILLFKAFKTNGELLGSSQVVLNTRTHADWYVNAESKEEKEDGSKSYPFKTLQKAIDNVNSSLNLICLQSNITINEPLIINQNTIIIGEDKVNNKGNRYVPRIFQKGIDKINSETLRYKRDFFKLVGNKDCELTLSNLRLVSGQINSFVGINTWKNTNNSLDIFESVVVHGGTVNLSVSFINQQEYYPFDFINCKFKLLKKDKTPLSNNIIQVYYKNQLITSLLTDENGECNYKFNLKETKIGEYTLHIVNKSEVFFEADIGKVIHVDKEPHYYYPHKNDDVKLEITKYTTEDAFNLYSDTNGLIDNIELSDENEHIIISEDTLKYKIENLDFGRYIFYSTNDNDIDGNVKEEWIVESLFPIAELPKDSENKTKFIKNLVFNNLTGDIIYDVFELPSNPKMQDLEDIILDVKPINNGTEIEVTTFRVPFESMDYEELLYSEAEVLMSAITEINLNMETGILSGKRLGKFW